MDNDRRVSFTNENDLQGSIISLSHNKFMQGEF